MAVKSLAIAAVFFWGCPAREPSSATRILEGQSVPVRDDVAELSGVSIDRFEEGRVKYRAHVDRARVDRRTGMAKGTGVTVEDASGMVLRAREMTYDSASEVIEAPAPVTLEGANFSASGGEMRIQTASGAIDVDGAIRLDLLGPPVAGSR